MNFTLATIPNSSFSPFMSYTPPGSDGLLQAVGRADRGHKSHCSVDRFDVTSSVADRLRILSRFVDASLWAIPRCQPQTVPSSLDAKLAAGWPVTYA